MRNLKNFATAGALLPSTLAAAQANCPDAGLCIGETKISQTAGGFVGPLFSGDRFGIGTAAIGDLDGDGISELAVGADRHDAGESEGGAVWILFLTPDGTVRHEQKITEGIGGFALDLDIGAAFSIPARVGDIDGDGTPDMAVGAPGAANGGAVYVLFLNEDGTVRSAQAIGSGQGGLVGPLDTDGAFGVGLAGVGDLDGDGITEIAVGARRDDDGGLNRGAVWLLFLNADGTVKGEQKISNLSGNFAGTLDNNDEFGSGVGSLGDLDDDGVPDIAVGAHLDDDGGGGRGAVWILFLNPDGTVKSHQKLSSTTGGFGGQLGNDNRFGTHLALLDDLDDDGVPELAVAQNEDDDGGANRGAVWVLFLNRDGTVRAERKISSTAGGFGGQLDDADGFSVVAFLGDIDQNGQVELAVGAHGDDDGADEAGAVWILTLDSCAPCPADLTGDYTIDTNDFFLFLGYYQFANPLADFTGDSLINTNDFFAYLAAYQLGCP